MLYTMSSSSKKTTIREVADDLRRSAAKLPKEERMRRIGVLLSDPETATFAREHLRSLVFEFDQEKFLTVLRNSLIHSMLLSKSKGLSAKAMRARCTALSAAVRQLLAETQKNIAKAPKAPVLPIK